VPEGDDVVVVRVDLDDGGLGDAVHVARERVHTLVGLARFRTGSDTWQPLNGCLQGFFGACGLILLFSMSMGWLVALVGLLARSPESVVGWAS
jgi:hypothetical protein